MKVRLERSGGFANVRRTTAVDATKLSPQRAAELGRLVAAADLGTFPEAPTPRAGKPDRFVYHLTVEYEGGVRTVTVSEDSTSEGMQQLLDWLQQMPA